MITAFNLAETWRVPVFFMMDEVVGHMIERVAIPAADQIEVVERKWTGKKPGDYKPFGATATDPVPEMVKAGDGYRIHITGLTHDERGYPALTVPAQKKLMDRLLGKIRDHRDEIVDVREDGVEGADVVVVSFGITSRVAAAAVEQARAQGVKVGHLRMVICWPFPSTRISQLADKVKAFVVPELNMGQMGLEVERTVAGRAKVLPVTHPGGTVHEPEDILKRILEAAR
jgi:2-oxoglutarate ferredoxin oxidoreductase subunit alpha